MRREIHKLFDVILKIIILVYLRDFLNYIGEKRKIVKILKTEITTLNGKTRHLDFLCVLEDDTLCHIEFQFPVAYPKDLTRFFDYNVVAEIRYNKLTETIVFNFDEEHKGIKKLSIGKSKDFHPKNFYLANIDFKHEIEKINVKLNLGHLEKIISSDKININLTYKEELHLMLMSLSPKYKNKKRLLKYAVGLLKNEKLFHEEKINIIKSIIQLEIDNLLSADDQKEFKGEIKMTYETERIITQALDEVNKKYEQMALDEAEEKGRVEGREEGIEKGRVEGREEGIEKGRVEGREEGMEEVAKKLKGILKPEEISKVTGLSLKTILLL